MSTRWSNSTTQALTRTTNVPTGSFTVCAWIRAASNLATFTSFVGGSDSGLNTSGNFWGIGTLSGLDLHFDFGADGATIPMFTMVVGSDYFVAVTVSGGTACTAYWSPAGGGTLSTASSTKTARTFTILSVGETDGDLLDGNMRELKIWDAVLTQAELQAEMLSVEPQRLTNLNSHFHMDTTTGNAHLTDTSGNSRNLTAGGTACTTGTDPTALSLALDLEPQREAWMHTATARTASAAFLAAASFSAMLAGNAQKDLTQDPSFTVASPQIEEEYWQNPTPPAPPTFYEHLPYLPDAEEIPAATLFGQYDEDFWRSGVPPALLAFQRLPIVDEEFPTLFGAFEDDSWRAPPFPYPQNFQVEPVIFDDDPAFPAAAGVEIEAYWSPVAPRPPTANFIAPLLDEDIPAGSLFGQYDESFWQAPVIQPTASPRLSQVDDDAVFPAAASTLDEDYWAAPLPATVQAPRLALVDEDLPTLFGVPEEDAWQAPLPARAAWVVRTFADDAAVFPLLTVDDDCWVNQVAPVLPTFLRAYLPDADEVIGIYVPLTIDEDYPWQAKLQQPQRWTVVYPPDLDAMVAQPLITTVTHYILSISDSPATRLTLSESAPTRLAASDAPATRLTTRDEEA